MRNAQVPSTFRGQNLSDSWLTLRIFSPHPDWNDEQWCPELAPGAWPFGVQAYAGREDNDLILWLPSINAIVTGDSLSDFGDGLDIQLGGRKHVTRDEVVRRLRPLLDLPVEHVLPAHGKPTDRAALEGVLS